jgi:hypothetical protein
MKAFSVKQKGELSYPHIKTYTYLWAELNYWT